jgi:deoxyuridine 5'-triphosphate nucleotidohydrolase
MNDLATIFRNNGSVNSASTLRNVEPVVSIKCDDDQMVSSVSSLLTVPFDIDIFGTTIVMRGCNAIDFMGIVAPKDHRLQEWLGNVTPCKVYKTDADAVMPSKARISDVGYDLTIIKKVKTPNNTTTLYDTGISIKMAHGMYAEVVPRSSISKSGYMLSNSIGIIDNSYTGNILIALTKIDADAPEIALPFRCCQLIIRHQVFVDITEVYAPLEETHRAGGGFGSTGGTG